MRMPTRWAGALAVLALLTAACVGEPEPPPGGEETEAGPTTGNELAIFVASYDLAVGEEERLTAGVLTQEQALLAGGEVTFAVAPADDEAAEPVETSARFLPVPGMEPDEEYERPTPLEGVAGTGVYEAFVPLDQPGMWVLEVQAELDDGSTASGSARFEVREEPAILDVGDEAPRTENLTIDDAEDVPPVAVDSRAQSNDGVIPDEHIHNTTIAEALEEGRPVAVLFSTPVYCVSRFCGPITDVFADLAREYEDRAAFIHVEVWRNFEESELNDAAAEWIVDESGGREPWTFLIDGDGTVLARWDNVLDAEALRQHLEELPADQ